MSNPNQVNADCHARVLKAIEQANLPDHPIAKMLGLMPEGRSPKQPWLKTSGGEKPSKALLHLAALWAKNTAGGEAGFVALQCRPEGASLSELAYAFGVAAAHNHSKAIGPGSRSGAGLNHFTRTQPAPRRWVMVLTPRGEKYAMAKLAGATAAVAATKVDKPAKGVSKPKGKAKPKGKGKVAPAETPTSEAPTANEGQHVTVDETVNKVTVVEVVETAETPNVGGVEAEADQAPTQTELQALAAHFNN